MEYTTELFPNYIKTQQLILSYLGVLSYVSTTERIHDTYHFHALCQLYDLLHFKSAVANMTAICNQVE